MQRTSPNSVFFTSYNLLNLFADDSQAAREHYGNIVSVIRSLGTDVLAVQEILAPDGPAAGQRLRQLADDTGLRCEVPGPGGRPEAALAVGGHGYQVGLMWRDGIEPLPGSLRCHGGRDFWHGLAVVTLDVGGTLIRHGAFHASALLPGPAGRPERAPGGRDHPAGRRAARFGRCRLEHRMRGPGPVGRRLCRSRSAAAHRRRPRDRAARRRHERAPCAGQPAGHDGLRSPAGDGRVPARRRRRLSRDLADSADLPRLGPV